MKSLYETKLRKARIDAERTTDGLEPMYKSYEKEVVSPPTKNRVCYALLPSQLADPSVKELDAIIVTEGESGYHKTDWKWAREFAEAARDKKNRAMDISPEEAEKMLTASMFHHA